MTSKIAHAAKVHDGLVERVIVIPHCDDDDEKITAYCNSIGLPGTWLDTSYLGKRRGVYAGVGFRYDSVADVFVAPEPVEVSDEAV
jgi:hypothetical protein